MDDEDQCLEGRTKEDYINLVFLEACVSKDEGRQQVFLEMLRQYGENARDIIRNFYKHKEYCRTCNEEYDIASNALALSVLRHARQREETVVHIAESTFFSEN